MEVASASVAVFGFVERTGQVTERLREGIPPKRHENVVDDDDDDPSSSSSWKEPQKGDYPVQLCSKPPGDSLNFFGFTKKSNPISKAEKGKNTKRWRVSQG
jgi:hypothetical protein